MNTRSVALLALLFAGCGPAAKAPPVAAPPPAPEPKPADPEPPYVYYQMVQAGHVELVVDEVRLEPEASRCFQAHRRLLGGFSFDQGADALAPDAFSAEVQSVVQAFAEWKGKGQNPALVLHGHAARDEADGARDARALSERRAEAVKARLVDSGIPADRLKIIGHGWDHSPPPLEPTESLKPNRRVELSPDQRPPSGAKRVEAPPVDPEVLAALQSKVRQLEGKSTLPAVALHAPRVLIVVNDASGKLELSFDVTSAEPDAVALHRYFLRGLSNDCTFDKP